ncbi:MAG: hypothetical protein JKY00_10945 [Roseicyclus sp.]|nr:hypothetical protein [Roseicyclus sp.]
METVTDGVEIAHFFDDRTKGHLPLIAGTGALLSGADMAPTTAAIGIGTRRDARPPIVAGRALWVWS